MQVGRSSEWTKRVGANLFGHRRAALPSDVPFRPLPNSKSHLQRARTRRMRRGIFLGRLANRVKHHRLLNLKPRLRAPLAGFGAIHERFLVAHQTFADSQMGVHQVAPFWGPRDQINVFQAFMLRPSFWHRKRAIDVFFRQPFSGAGRTFLNSIASSD